MAARKGLGLSRIADAVGVSVATVSNTINRPEIVAEATRERVLAAMRELDFVPNRAAATLRKGSNRLLGVVVPEIVNPFYAAITEAIAVAAGERGYALALCVSHDDDAVELRHFEMLAEQRAAGVIVVPRDVSGEQLARLQMVGTRLVLIDRSIDEHDGCSVVMNDVLGGQIAADHLLQRHPGSGITLVNGPAGIPQCVDRRAGTLTSAASHGLDPEVAVREFVAPHMEVEDGIRIGRAIAASDAPREIFCTNDQLALGVIRGLRESGLSVPADARVVGYGDLALAVEGDTGITSVAQPKTEMGRAAVDKVLSEIRDGSNHRHSITTFPPELVLRASAP